MHTWIKKQFFLGNITWPEMEKQNIQAKTKKVY